MQVKVKATRIGYFDLKRRHEGDEFMMSDADAKKHSWVDVIGGKQASEPAAKPAAFTVPMKKGAKPTGDAEVI